MKILEKIKLKKAKKILKSRIENFYMWAILATSGIVKEERESLIDKVMSDLIDKTFSKQKDFETLSEKEKELIRNEMYKIWKDLKDDLYKKANFEAKVENFLLESIRLIMREKIQDAKGMNNQYLEIKNKFQKIYKEVLKIAPKDLLPEVQNFVIEKFFIDKINEAYKKIKNDCHPETLKFLENGKIEIICMWKDLRKEKMKDKYIESNEILLLKKYKLLFIQPETQEVLKALRQYLNAISNIKAVISENEKLNLLMKAEEELELRYEKYYKTARILLTDLTEVEREFLIVQLIHDLTNEVIEEETKSRELAKETKKEFRSRTSKIWNRLIKKCIAKPKKMINRDKPAS